MSTLKLSIVTGVIITGFLAWGFVILSLTNYAFHGNIDGKYRCIIVEDTNAQNE